MIVPSGHVNAAVGRVPAGGKVVLQLLALNSDRHGLAADFQHDRLTGRHARNLTCNVGQSWVLLVESTSEACGRAGCAHAVYRDQAEELLRDVHQFLVTAEGIVQQKEAS